MSWDWTAAVTWVVMVIYAGFLLLFCGACTTFYLNDKVWKTIWRFLFLHECKFSSVVTKWDNETMSVLQCQMYLSVCICRTVPSLVHVKLPYHDMLWQFCVLYRIANNFKGKGIMSNFALQFKVYWFRFSKISENLWLSNRNGCYTIFAFA